MENTISGVKTVISAIEGTLGLESQDLDECECALEALGQIGLCKCFIFGTLTNLL